MTRTFDAKQASLAAYPDDREAGVRLLLDYLNTNEDDFIYEQGMMPEEYIYGPRPPEATACNCGALFPNDVHHSDCASLRVILAAVGGPSK
jgi:hypothetical protein